MNTQVFTAACPDYDQVRAAVRRLLDGFGGAEAFLKKGKRVAIKPNLLMARDPETATTAHPAVVAAVAEAFVKAGADVVIADSPGGPYNAYRMGQVYKACGMVQAAAQSGAHLNHDFSHREVMFRGRTLKMISPVADADTVISIGKAKTHMLTGFTGAAKNLYGCIAGLEKAAWHSRLPKIVPFCALLCDITECAAPALSIIDGVLGMDGKGPSGGRARKAGVLTASENPFAADFEMMRICGIDPSLAPLHKEAVRRGLVPADVNELTQLGDRVPPLDVPFVPAAKLKNSHALIGYLPRPLRTPLRRLLLPFPKFGTKCVGCGRCAEACPQHAIHVTDGHALVERRLCIQCYCCHELCPVKAVEL